MSIQEFHGKAYDWTPEVSAETLYKETEGSSYLLRTKLRAAIEFFDQLFLYGEAGKPVLLNWVKKNLMKKYLSCRIFQNCNIRKL